MKKVIYITLLLTSLLIVTSCDGKDPIDPNNGKEHPTEYPEIKIGDEDLNEIILDKDSTRDFKLSGGNEKFTVSVADSKVVVAKIDGIYLRIKGVNYGETTLVIKSHNKRRELKVRVERSEINISQAEVRLYPGEVRHDVKVTGGGDDAEMEIENPEDALIAKWDAKSGTLEFTAKYEGESKLIFRTNDSKEPKTIKVIIKAENDVSDKAGIYRTSNRSLSPYFPTVLVGQRKGKRVWVASSSDVVRRDKARFSLPMVKAPQLGEKLDINLSMVNLDALQDLGKNPFIVEYIDNNKLLVTLRTRGYKIVVPFEAN